MSPFRSSVLAVVLTSLTANAGSDPFGAPPPPPPASSAQNTPPPVPADVPLPPPPDEAAPPPPKDAITGTPPAPLKPDDRPSIASKYHRFSITVSPLLWLLGIVEATAEFRLGDKMGVAAVFGLGGPRDSRYQYFAVDLAGQFRYYLIGTFDHGFDLGAQVKTLILTDGYITWGGLSVTPMVGYKIATTIGFTFDAQLGPEFIVSGPTASLLQVNTAPAVPIGLLLNLNVGWSF